MVKVNDRRRAKSMGDPGVSAQLADLRKLIGEVHEAIIGQIPPKDWYTPEEAGKMIGKAKFTVQEYCRLGRIHASKRPTGRGRSLEWMISRSEIDRFRNEGLLPIRKD